MLHMPVLQVYQSKKYASFWERAEAKAIRQGISMAEYLGRLVRADVMAGDRHASTEALVQQVTEAAGELAKRAESKEV